MILCDNGHNTVPISKRALIQRLRRKLKDDGLELRRSRGRDQRALFGEYYLVFGERGVVDQEIVPEILARKIGCLRTWEVVV